MKKNEIKIGQCYLAKVTNRIVTVRIDSTNSHGGWNGTNTSTGKRIHIKSAQPQPFEQMQNQFLLHVLRLMVGKIVAAAQTAGLVANQVLNIRIEYIGAQALGFHGQPPWPEADARERSVMRADSPCCVTLRSGFHGDRA